MKSKLFKLSLGTLLFFTGLLFSQESSAERPTMQNTKGFYIGANPGFRSLTTKWTGETTVSNGADSHQLSNERHGGGQGFVGRFGLGYGLEFQEKFYLALNLFGDMSSASVKGTSEQEVGGVEYSNSFKFKHAADLGVGIRPGINIFSKGLVFLDLSYISGYFKNETESSGDLYSYSDTAKKWRSGFEVGLGTKLDLSNNKQRLFLGLEAHYHVYQRMNTSFSASGNGGSVIGNYTTKPSGLDAAFSITHLF
jgi:opacity protein-like surface antigen